MTPERQPSKIRGSGVEKYPPLLLVEISSQERSFRRDLCINIVSHLEPLRVDTAATGDSLEPGVPAILAAIDLYQNEEDERRA